MKEPENRVLACQGSEITEVHCFTYPKGSPGMAALVSVQSSLTLQNQYGGIRANIPTGYPAWYEHRVSTCRH